MIGFIIVAVIVFVIIGILNSRLRRTKSGYDGSNNYNSSTDRSTFNDVPSESGQTGIGEWRSGHDPGVFAGHDSGAFAGDAGPGPSFGDGGGGGD